MIKSKKLDWDSSFFKKRIYQIEIEGDSDNEIDLCLTTLLDEGNELVYLFSPKEILSSKFKSTLVDKKRTYTLFSPQECPINLEIQPFTGSPEILYELAYQSGEFSRFNIDPLFTKEEFKNLYRKWIDNSLNNGFADYVLVYQDKDEVKGFITAKEKDGVLKIGLFATDIKYRSQGIGSALMHTIINIAARDGLKVEVTTQADNRNACQFYEHNGFNKYYDEYVYHIWKSQQNR